MTRTTYHSRPLFFLLILTVVGYGWSAFQDFSQPALAQSEARSSRPIRKTGILAALKVNGLSTAEFVSEIERRGVDFQMTPADEQEFLAAGARPEIIAAIRAGYRGAPPVKTGGKGKNGGDSLDKVVGVKRPPKGLDYDDVFDQGVEALKNQDANTALARFATATGIRPEDPKAYAMLGYTHLYVTGNLPEAERNMAQAINLGGTAVFRVYHDHDGFFGNFCSGSLFVGRNDVTFRADDGKHTFAADRATIKEVKTNGFVGSELGAFHVKVRLGKDKDRNYNFAPLTKQRFESDLVVRLYRSF